MKYLLIYLSELKYEFAQHCIYVRNTKYTRAGYKKPNFAITQK